MKIQGYLTSISTVENVSLGSDLILTDSQGELYFFIVCDGFVKEYYVENGTEVPCAFYFENDFFGLKHTFNKSHSTSFKAMEPTIVCKLYWREWEQIASVCTSLNKIWLNMIENQCQNKLDWFDIFTKNTIPDFVKTMLVRQPMVFKEGRIEKIVESLQLA